jgi:hypothetical protein
LRKELPQLVKAEHRTMTTSLMQKLLTRSNSQHD